MKRPNSDRFWNTIIILASLTLLITGFIGMRRLQTASAYEDLAKRREEQTQHSTIPALSLPLTAPRGTEGGEIVKGETLGTTRPRPSVLTEQNKTWLSINPDFSGWLDIPGTRIEYPFVRSRDNQDYLKKDFYGNYSDAGTLFLDYRNIGNFKDTHTILYGHNMKNQTMFHDLVYYHDRKFYDDHSFITVSGLFEEKTYRIFSVYEISADDYEFELHFNDRSSYGSYLNKLAGQSLHSQAVSDLSLNSALLTLVTCSYGTDNGRTVVHALELESQP